MGNYCTTDNIRTDLGSDLVTELSSATMPSGVTEEVYLEFLITKAEGKIDAVLKKWYNTPIVTDQSDGFLLDLTLSLVNYEIWSKSVGDDIPTKHKTAYEQALMTLEDILEGTMTPFDDNNNNSSIDVTSDTRRMGEDELSVF